MVRTGKSHHPPEPEDDDAQDIAAGNDGSSHSDGKSSEQKANNSKSKHSETEQRRRCKINERFQILKNLIPPNDQKRDKASLLLEVIEYIQFLQEKLQVYEGSNTCWNPDPARLIPWISSAPMESSVDHHSQIMKSGSGQENNVIQPIRNEQPSAESSFGGNAAYKGADYLSATDTSAVPLSMPLQPGMYPSGTNFLPSENLASKPPTQTCWSRPFAIGCPITRSSLSETQPRDISSVYSHGLVKKLTQAFQSSGVDTSQTSISVQLDIGRRANTSAIAGTSAAEVIIHKVSESNGSMSRSGTGTGRENDDSSPSAKRPRMGGI